MKHNKSKHFEARRLYEQENLKLIDIANRIGVKASTVRSWKSKDKITGNEWINNKAPVPGKEILYSSFLSPKARIIYNNASEIKDKTKLLEAMISIKFANILASQSDIDLSDTSQSQADSIAFRTLTNMIKDYYKIKSETKDINNDLNKVDLILQELEAQAWAGIEEND